MPWLPFEVQFQCPLTWERHFGLVSSKQLYLKLPVVKWRSEFLHHVTVPPRLLFQVESSNPWFNCSEFDLQSLFIMPCNMGWTMPRSGRWEGSPAQLASISCQHSSSKTGRRSGRTPVKIIKLTTIIWLKIKTPLFSSPLALNYNGQTCMPFPFG